MAPYTVHKILSHVTQLTDFEVNYEITIRLEGVKMNGPLVIPLTNKELQVYSKLAGCEYFGDDDSRIHSILARVASKLKATLGIETVVLNEAEEVTGGVQ